MEQTSYKTIEIHKDNWDETIKDFIPDLMFRSEYVELLSQSFHFHLKYIIIKEKGIINLACVIFYKKKKVVLADNYSYQPLWVNPLISERRQISVLTHFINYIKTDFNNVKFKLNALIADIRPFRWEGFSIEPRFTYFRYNNTPVHKKISGRLNKLKNQMSAVLISEPSEDDISVNIDFVKSLNFKNSKANSYQSFLIGLRELGYLKSFTLKDGSGVNCAYLVLADLAQKKAYALMVNGADRSYRQIHSLLYQEINKWADENDIKTVDFCGANMKGISNFKSYFNPRLQLYYIVRYSYFQKVIAYFTQIINKF